MSKLRYESFAERIDIDAFEAAIGFEPLHEDRGNDIGHCLFPENHTHGDSTGKFAIHREKMVYNCWVCGGGDLLSLTMELHPEWDVDEATHWLHEFAHGDTRDDDEFLEDWLSFLEDTEQRVETLPFFNERVLERYDDSLLDAWDADKGEWWLDSRDISLGVAQQFGIRFQESSRRPAPRKGKFADEEDYYGPSIIFPHYWNKRLVGWQQRWLDPDRPEWLPKYTNTTGFPKDSTVYNYGAALKSREPVIVCESGPTVVFLRGRERTAVATFGSSINPPQLRLLRRLSSGVILAPDNDKAGTKWLSTATEYLRRFIPVWHLPPVEGEGSDLGNLTLPAEALNEHLDLAYVPELSWD